MFKREYFFLMTSQRRIQFSLDIGKPDEEEEEEDKSFIVYCVAGDSFHIYDSWKISQGQNYYFHFRDKESEFQRISISSSRSHT